MFFLTIYVVTFLFCSSSSIIRFAFCVWCQKLFQSARSVHGDLGYIDIDEEEGFMKWMLTSYFLLTSEVTTTSFTLLFLSIRYFRTILHYPAAKTSWVALCNHGYCDRSQKDKKEKQTKVLRPRNVWKWAIGMAMYLDSDIHWQVRLGYVWSLSLHLWFIA